MFQYFINCSGLLSVISLDFCLLAFTNNVTTTFVLACMTRSPTPPFKFSNTSLHFTSFYFQLPFHSQVSLIINQATQNSLFNYWIRISHNSVFTAVNIPRLFHPLFPTVCNGMCMQWDVYAMGCALLPLTPPQYKPRL